MLGGPACKLNSVRGNIYTVVPSLIRICSRKITCGEQRFMKWLRYQLSEINEVNEVKKVPRVPYLYEVPEVPQSAEVN